MIRVQNGDSIKISSFSSKAGVVLKIYGQILLPGGKIIPFEDGLTTTATRLEVSKNIPVTNGYLISISVGVSSGSLMQAQCFIKAEHQLGVQAPYTSLKTLFSDYITTNTNCTFPESPLNKSFNGKGYTSYVYINDPVVGQPVNLTAPTNAIWKILFFQIDLISTANTHGGYGRELIAYKRITNIPGQTYYAHRKQPVSVTEEYQFVTDTPESYYGDYSAKRRNIANLGEIIIQETEIFVIASFPFWADDTLTNGAIQYEEWINV